MYCSMCGKKTEDLFLIEIEDSRLEVCEICSQSGARIIRKIEKPPEPKFKRPEQSDEIIEDIVPNYAQIIRGIHQGTGLKTEDFAKKINERESVVKKIESGKMEPSLKLARKLEKMFDVKLIEESKNEPGPKKYTTYSESSGATLGDVVKFRKS